MERETILPDGVTRGLIAIIVLLLSLSILSIGDYSTSPNAAGRTDASETCAETETELTAE